MSLTSYWIFLKNIETIKFYKKMKTGLNKILIILLVLLLSSLSYLLQAENTPPDTTTTIKPAVLVGFGIGINDYGAGLGIEIPIISKLSIYSDFGIGGWGNKVGLGFNYHFQQITKGSVISLGFAKASGLKNYEVDLMVEPEGETQTVKLDLKSVYTINFKYTYNFKLAKKSKFGLSAGYSIPLSSNNYKVLSSGIVLSPESEYLLNFMQPGGLIIGFRFLFGIGKGSYK